MYLDSKAMSKIKPLTTQAYEELQLAHDHFNRELFAQELPCCPITLQRNPLLAISPLSASTTAPDSAPTRFLSIPPTSQAQHQKHFIHLGA
jgi:hypothetical protein